MTLELNKIYCGDCLDLMREMPDKCVDLTVTSPPYDNLRDYKGYSFRFEETANELYRITKDGGVVVWVVNDATINGSETGTSFRQALFFKEIGFNLHDTMIYAKKNPTPYHHNRYNPAFEFMFVFSNGKPAVFNPIKIHTGNKRTGNYRYPDGSLRSANTQESSGMKMLNNIFYYSVGTDKEVKEHPAKFPEKLAEDHILSWSNPGDIVFDPFMGSGTTAKMALKNGRRFIGIDISQEYCDIAEKRLEKVNNHKLTDFFNGGE